MEYVKQTGILVKPIAPENYVMGGYTKLSAVARMPSGNWGSLLPTKEKQYAFLFDTLSCTTFSALNQCEIQGEWLINNGHVEKEDIKWLKDNGYFDENNKLNFSDRFIAIMSGTTKYGNDFVSVWDCIRNIGLIPEKDFPFNAVSFTEYHDKTKITSSMIVKANKFKEIFGVQFEWVFFHENVPFTQDELNKIKEALTHAPLHIGIKHPATHAVTMYSNERDILDHYEPYTYKYSDKNPIHFGMKGYMFVKEKPVKYTFTKTLKQGMRGNEVLSLQRFLNTDPDTSVAKIGSGSAGQETNYFGPYTKNAVISFQEKNGLYPDGVFGPKSAAKAVEIQKKK